MFRALFNEKGITKMQTIYNLSSAQEITIDLLESIKAAFKSKPITIIVEETMDELTEDQKLALDERLTEDEKECLTSDESIDRINQKYGL